MHPSVSENNLESRSLSSNVIFQTFILCDLLNKHFKQKFCHLKYLELIHKYGISNITMEVKIWYLFIQLIVF